MHASTLDYVAILQLARHLKANPTQAYSDNKKADLRVETYKNGNTPVTSFAVFTLSTQRLKALVTCDSHVVRRYTQLIGKLPIHERFELSIAGILMTNLLEQGKYQAVPDENNTLLKQFNQFIEWALDAEATLNQTEMVSLPTFEHASFPKTKALIDKISPSDNTNPNSFDAILRIGACFLQEFHQNNLACWNTDWNLLLQQIRIDLAALSIARPLTPVPVTQSEWLWALLPPTTDYNTQVLENEADEPFYLISDAPSLIETVHFLHAAQTDEALEKIEREFLPELTYQMMLLGLRAAATPFDLIQLIWNQLPGTLKTTYCSTRFEGLLLGYQVFGLQRGLVAGTLLRNSLQPVSTQLVSLLAEFVFKDLTHHVKHFLQLIITDIFAVALLTGKMLRDLDAELREPGKNFKLALSTARLQQIASELKTSIQHDIEKLEIAYPAQEFPLDHAARQALIQNLDKIIGSVTTDNDSLFNSISKIYHAFSAEQVNFRRESALAASGWERGELTGVTSYFPTLLTHEFCTFINGRINYQRESVLAAATLGLAGIFGAPGFHQVVDSVNRYLTGKSLETSAKVDIISLIFMGMAAFQVAMLATSLFYKNKSLLMLMVTFMAADPIKVALGITALIGLAQLQLQEPVIDFLKLLSCDLKISKTSLLLLPEQAVRELFEAKHMATFPYITYMLITFKVIMVLRSLLGRDRYPMAGLAEMMTQSNLTNEALANAATQHPNKLVELLTWYQFSKDRDLFGRVQSSLFLSVRAEVNQLPISPERKQAIITTLYRQYMTSPTAVAVNFLYHATHAVALSMAYTIPVVPQQSLFDQPRALKWNLDTTGAVIKYAINLTFVATATWWMYIYRMERDGNPFMALLRIVISVFVSSYRSQSSHQDHPETHCVSHAACFDATHSLHEEIIEACMASLTNCQCDNDGSSLTPIENGMSTLKTVFGIFIVINALLCWSRWNTPLTQEAREHTKDYWKLEGARLMQFAIDTLLTVFHLATASVDSLYSLVTCKRQSPCSEMLMLGVRPVAHTLIYGLFSVQPKELDMREVYEAFNTSTANSHDQEQPSHGR